MPERSIAYQLVEERLGADLEAYVAQMRAEGLSWNRLAVDLNNRTGVLVTTVTLRSWFPSSTSTRASGSRRGASA